MKRSVDVCWDAAVVGTLHHDRQGNRESSAFEYGAAWLRDPRRFTAAEASVIDSDGTPVALIRRFDRDAHGGRIGYISAATLLGVDPADGAEHAYTEIVDALRVHGSDVPRDLEELWRRIAFSILITNVDDHLLNLGFLAGPDGRWRLAPAFDLNPFPDRARAEDLDLRGRGPRGDDRRAALGASVLPGAGAARRRDPR